MKQSPLRHLHHGHFAFMRAVVQGIDAQDSWDRYMRAEGEHRDGRTVRRTITWIRDAFAAAAKQAKRPGLARLILLEANRVPPAAAPPSLEEFAALHGLEDFSEDEQLEAYQAAIALAPSTQAPGRREGRRQRLVVKQLEALRWLEQQVAKAPGAADPLSSWLDDAIARRLARAGLRDVAQLVVHVNAWGHRWWLRIPGIGARKGARVLEWLQLHAKDIGMDVGAHVLVPRKLVASKLLASVTKVGTGLRPYEKLEIPAGLRGGPAKPEGGEGGCLLPARNDREAVDSWLDAAPRSTATRRSYRKEAERLLLWAVLVRRKAMSSLDGDDLQAYRDFLSAPPAEWCGPRHVQRWSPRWRPLEGPLAPAAVRQAFVVLHGLFAFWIRRAYIKSNPFAAQPLRALSPPKAAVPRTITLADWAELEILLEQEVSTVRGRRVARALRWLRFSGLGLAELTKVRCEHLHQVQASLGDSEWTIALEDGPRSRLVKSIPAALVKEFQTELHCHGRPADVTDARNQRVHILARFEVQGGLPPPWSTSGFAKAVRAVFDRAAARAGSAGAERWAQASARSLRVAGPRRSAPHRQSDAALRVVPHVAAIPNAVPGLAERGAGARPPPPNSIEPHPTTGDVG